MGTIIEAPLPPVTEEVILPRLEPVVQVAPVVQPVPLTVDNINLYPDYVNMSGFIVVEGPSHHWEYELQLGYVKLVHNVEENGTIVVYNIYYSKSRNNMSKKIYNNVFSYGNNYYNYKQNRSFMAVSNNQALLTNEVFLQAYHYIMNMKENDYSTFSQSYIEVRKYSNTFNLPAIFGKNICKLLDAIIVTPSSVLDFDKKDLFELIFLIYLPHVKRVIYFMVVKMIHHPLIWEYIITNPVCRDMLTHAYLKYDPTKCRLLSDEQHIYIRNNMITDSPTKDNTDWFGYNTYPAGPIINKTTSLFSFNDIKGHSCTCVMCGDDIIPTHDDESNDTIALCGIAGPDCECFMCVGCALDMGKSLLTLANGNHYEGYQNLNIKCLGCGCEITREFFYILMLLLEYTNFKIDNGVKLYKQLLGVIEIINVKLSLSNPHIITTKLVALMNKLNNRTFSDFVILMYNIQNGALENHTEAWANVLKFGEAFSNQIHNKHLIWLQECKTQYCKRRYLLDPNSEMYYTCQNCGKGQNVVGSIKEAANLETSKELLELVKSSSNLQCCPNCHKILEKIKGCNSMQCFYCKKTFKWDSDKTAINAIHV